MSYIVLDFETASAVDLATVGAARYFEDPSTEILTLCWVTDQGIRGVWHPGEAGEGLHALAADPTVQFIAHNTWFEINAWRRLMVPDFGFPDVPDERWEDSQAVCHMKAIQPALERALPLVGLDIEKDMKGNRLTLSLSKPNKKGELPERTPEVMAKVDAYCASDVEAQAALHRRIGGLPPGERAVWLLDLKINSRGLALDMPYVRACEKIVDAVTGPMGREFEKLTGVRLTQGTKVMEWVNSRGVALPNLQKATLAAALGASVLDMEDDEDEGAEPAPAWLRQLAGTMPDDVRRVLQIRRIAGSASIKKLRRMSLVVNVDGRARGLVQYHGANTGRWAGRLIQPHNFPRGVIHLDAGTKAERAPDPQTMVDIIMTGDPEYVASVLGDPIEVVLSGLRHAIIPGPERLLVVGDFAGIEARIVLALAGQHDKTALMASGVDVYCDMATSIYGWQVTKANVTERTVGKCTVLGAGFGMGWKTFKARYGAALTAEDCTKAIDAYRKDWAPCVPELWKGLERAAIRAVWEGGAHEAYGCTYQIEDIWLSCRMPSGRKIWYENPQRIRKAVPWDEDDLRRAWTYEVKKNGRWITVDAYGGLLCENVVQALARDLMAGAMFLCEKNGLPVVLTVHDEIVAEPKISLATKEALYQMMTDRPRWAVEMQVPVSADCWIGNRYRK